MKPLPEALSIARQMDMDLVEVAAEANPPVCRIMDYNRFKYEAAQRAKESRRKATSTGIKEMKYRPKIGTGDFDTKTRQVARFLGEGHKVKITIMFRGREMSHPELGKKILDHVADQVSAVAKVEAAPKLDGRNMIMVLAPDRRAQQATRSTSSQNNGQAVHSDAHQADHSSGSADTANVASAQTDSPPTGSAAEPPVDEASKDTQTPASQVPANQTSHEEP